MFNGPWFLNRDMIFTSDPANYQYITATNYRNYELMRGSEFKQIFDIFGDGIFNSDSKLWEFQRKTTVLLINHAQFKKVAEETMWNDVHKKLVLVLDYMSERGTKVDLQNIFHRLTLDVIINLILDDYDPQTLSVDLPYNAYDAAFSKSHEVVFYRHLLPIFCWKSLKILQIGYEKHSANASKLAAEFFDNLINENEKRLSADDFEKEQLEDVKLLSGFTREYKNYPGNPCKFMRDTLLNIVFAGRETTSSALTWFFYLLMKNPIVERKISEEIQEHLGTREGEKWRDFGAKQFQTLVYLHAALCEALRLFPPVPLNPKVPQVADTLPSGHRVHPGTKIFLHSYAMGRMETIWGQDCFEFRPERWISEQGGITHMPSYKFTAFHSGPRACLGRDMSLTHMKIVAATIIYNYNVKMVDGHPDTQDPSVILNLKYGFMVTLTKKN